MSSSHGEFGGASTTQRVVLTKGPSDGENTGWIHTLFFSLIGTTVWSMLATIGATGFGPNSAAAIALDALGLFIVICLMGNVCLAFYEIATTLTNAISTFVMGRRYVAGNADKTGYGWWFLYVALLLAAQLGGEFLGQGLAWGYFSGDRDDLGMADYPDNWAKGHSFGSEIILMATFTLVAHYASFKMYGSLKDNGSDDATWVVDNHKRAIVVGVARFAVLLAASTAGAALLNPGRYLVKAIYTNSWPLPGVFLGGALIGAVVAAVLTILFEMLEFNTVVSEIKSNNKTRVMKSHLPTSVVGAPAAYNRVSSSSGAGLFGVSA